MHTNVYSSYWEQYNILVAADMLPFGAFVNVAAESISNPQWIDRINMCLGVYMHIDGLFYSTYIFLVSISHKYTLYPTYIYKSCKQS